ncbi:MAG TPA: hypothetical protein VJU86_02735 [Pyrinomonadaceae bacterium]|nr:hypothetical protein [Pyrinomonadaceae bacterium]
METDFTETLSIFFQQTDPELQSRLEGQDEGLREITCTQPMVGRWIDSIFTGYLFAVFKLKDADFANMFPQLRHINAAQRHRIIEVMENHIGKCQRCSLLQGYDLEFEARFKKACRQNGELLLELLTEDEGEVDLVATGT